MIRDRCLVTNWHGNNLTIVEHTLDTVHMHTHTHTRQIIPRANTSKQGNTFLHVRGVNYYLLKDNKQGGTFKSTELKMVLQSCIFL